MQEIRLIKRYANRRLYDAETSRTVTLEDLADYIKNGEEVRVFDNNGEDITARVLGQTFLKVAADQGNQEFYIFLMSTLIREVSTNVSGFLSRLVKGGIGSSMLNPEKLEKMVESMVEDGELNFEEKSEYLGRIQGQMQFHESRLEKTVQAGRELFLSEVDDDLSKEGVRELATRLDEMARIVREMEKK